MTIKTLLGISANNRSRGSNSSNGSSGSSWTFGWTSSQAAALSTSAAPKAAKRRVSEADRQVGVYGVLATHNATGR